MDTMLSHVLWSWDDLHLGPPVSHMLSLPSHARFHETSRAMPSFSRSVPFIKAIAAACTSSGAFTGGPFKFHTAPQSVVTCASLKSEGCTFVGWFQDTIQHVISVDASALLVPVTGFQLLSSLRIKSLAQDGRPFSAL